MNHEEKHVNIIEPNLSRGMVMKSTSRLILFVGLLALSGFPLRADVLTELTPGQLQKAEAAYRDTFAMAHDKASKSVSAKEKSEYARKLYDASAKAAGDPALQEVLRKYALQFAQSDAAGVAVAIDVYRAYLAYPSKKALALSKLGGLYEKSLPFEPAASRVSRANEAIKSYRDAITEYEKQGNATAAIAEVAKARAAARKYTPNAKETFAGLDSDEKRLQSLASEQSDLDKLKAAIEKNPMDSKLRVSMACRYLKLNKIRDAVDHFATAGPEWIDLAKKLESAKPDAIDLAQQLGKNAGGLPTEDKKNRYILLDYARGILSEFRVSSPDAEAKVLPIYTSLLEKIFGLEPPSQTPKIALALLLCEMDVADAQIERRAYAEALAAITKAKSTLRSLKPADAKDFAPELDAMEKALKSRVTLEAEVEKLRTETKPGDAKGQLALGIGLLRVGYYADAIAPLKASGTKAWQDIAAMLALKDKANPYELANAIRATSAELKGEERADILAIARDRYETYLATNPPDIERTRVELIVSELPKSAMHLNRRKPVNLFSDTYFKMMNEKAYGPAKLTVESGSWVLNNGEKILNPGLHFKISERPSKPHEFRYIAFSCRSDSSANVSFYMMLSGVGDLFRGYYLGKPNEHTSVKHAPGNLQEMTVVVRDLYKDFGAVEFTGFGLFTNSSAEYGAAYLGDNAELVRRAVLRSQK